MKHTLFDLPVKLGSLALADPVRSVADVFTTSKEATRIMQKAVQNDAEVNMGEHMTHLQTIVGAANYIEEK